VFFFIPGLELIHVLSRFMTVHLLWDVVTAPFIVECLKSLPNLHTLEMPWEDGFAAILLKHALKGVNLPQIKTLILPPAAYPLLEHCCNVEDVVCVVRGRSRCSDEFLGFLTSNKNSKVKRLAIPLFLCDHPSRK
jgi:hypothetical protein